GLFVADQREAAGPAGGAGMSPRLRWFLTGVGAALTALLLALIFAAYQMPELLLDWANIRYCG
ncbi:MAG: hypothetical protein WCD32_14110, partial [Azonexus sp.]